MKNLFIEPCGEQDIDILAGLRRRQIEEENYTAPVDNAAVVKQINEWLLKGHQVFFLKWDADIVGFAVIDITSDPYSLKYFYASRNFRRSGMKVLDFRKLIDLLDTDSLEVKVNARNTSSRLFWETFGFRERAVCLRFSKTRNPEREPSCVSLERS